MWDDKFRDDFYTIDMKFKETLQPVIDRIVKKPTLLVIIPIMYFFLVLFAKWQLSLPVGALWFFLGGIIGIYSVDVVEEFFHVSPSPFRSMMCVIGLFIVGFYTITSTREMIPSGMVLSLSLTLFLFQVSEWRIRKNLDSWYVMFFGSAKRNVQRIVLIVTAAVFLLETMMFIMG